MSLNLAVARNLIKTKKNYSFQCRIGHMNEVGMCYGYNILQELNAYKISEISVFHLFWRNGEDVFRTTIILQSKHE